jgi:hypothetical protein
VLDVVQHIAAHRHELLVCELFVFRAHSRRSSQLSRPVHRTPAILRTAGWPCLSACVFRVLPDAFRLTGGFALRVSITLHSLANQSVH